jgi:hypothetical protein
MVGDVSSGLEQAIRKTKHKRLSNFIAGKYEGPQPELPLRRLSENFPKTYQSMNFFVAEEWSLR